MTRIKLLIWTLILKVVTKNNSKSIWKYISIYIEITGVGGIFPQVDFEIFPSTMEGSEKYEKWDSFMFFIRGNIDNANY